MATRYVLFWFDVEDCTVPQSDDCARRIAEIFTARGQRATMKLVGQKCRVLRERVRYKVIDALGKHAIGFHSDMHGGRPQPAEYMAPHEWLEGQREFETRERRGVDEIEAMFGVTPCTYGQPGSNWSPQVFPVLRQWGIPTYVSSFGYVGLHAQPFRYGGIVNTSRMGGTDRRGRPAQHVFGLGFDVGMPAAEARHHAAFDASYELLEDGGMISIGYHPCQLVLEEWFSTFLKPREQTLAGFERLDALLGWVLGHPEVECITAEDLPRLYPDRAQGRVFSAEELRALALGVGDEVYFQGFEGMTLSAAELLGMFARFLAQAVREGTVPAGVSCEYVDGPAERARLLGGPATQCGPVEFARSVLMVADFLTEHGRVPDIIGADTWTVPPGEWFCLAAQMVAHLVETGELAAQATTMMPVPRIEEHVSDEAARNSWGSVMHYEGFDGSRLLEQAMLQAWTLKPAILAR